MLAFCSHWHWRSKASRASWTLYGPTGTASCSRPLRRRDHRHTLPLHRRMPQRRRLQASMHGRDTRYGHSPSQLAAWGLFVLHQRAADFPFPSRRARGTAPSSDQRPENRGGMRVQPQLVRRGVHLPGCLRRSVQRSGRKLVCSPARHLQGKLGSGDLFRAFHMSGQGVKCTWASAGHPLQPRNATGEQRSRPADSGRCALGLLHPGSRQDVHRLQLPAELVVQGHNVWRHLRGSGRRPGRPLVLCQHVLVPQPQRHRRTGTTGPGAPC